jgi:hypothetical protein
MSHLVEGKIPSHTECPFRSQCSFAENNTCHHNGKAHTIAYSCGAARAFDLVNRDKENKHDNT